jgi:hypothetical protein
MVMQIQMDRVRGETQKLEIAVNALEPRIKAIQEMKTSKLRKEQIFEGIDRLRGKQLHLGKINNDLNMAVPEEVWLLQPLLTMVTIKGK